MRRRFFHPITSLLLLALLLADVWFLPYHTLMGGYSTAGHFINHQLLNRDYPRGFRRRPQMSIIRSADGLTLKDPDIDSMDAISRARLQEPRDVMDLTYSPVDVRMGFWAPTTHVQKHSILITFGENFTPDQRAAARRMFVEASGAAEQLSFADFQTLATTDIDRTTTLWLGYIHNALAVAALILFLLSLRWVPQTPYWIRARIGQRRLSRGLCPRCRYNLHGLRESRCPECGTAIDEPRTK